VPVKFGARQNVLVFDKADVERPFVTHNADLLAILAPQLEAELTQQLAQKSVSEQVKGILKRLLAGQRPGLEAVAGELRLSTRTLQRRLTGERATFQQLMEDARRELAQHYLLHSSLELTRRRTYWATKMPIPSFEPSTTGRNLTWRMASISREIGTDSETETSPV